MSSKTLPSSFIILLILLVLLPGQTLGQSIGGTFFGVVKDPTGPVPQAEVRITNLATGQGRFVFTDDQGRYELREVPPGLYELKVSKDGYNVVATPAAGLQLGLAQVARVDDITLKVAPALPPPPAAFTFRGTLFCVIVLMPSVAVMSTW